MNHQKDTQIMLENTTATLTPYLLQDSKAKGVVIVLPGGGYTGHADHEGEPVAKAYNQGGYHAYVLHYRVSQGAPLENAALYDVCTAIAYAKDQSHALKVSSDKIAVCGFSAGGHLAGASGVFWHQPQRFGGHRPAQDYKPATTILCYPVISEDFPHVGSFTHLAGKDTARWREHSLEKHLGEHTVPSFLWHTAEDAGVPVSNTLCFAQALAEHNIPVEAHVFPKGPHGIGLATHESGSNTHDPYASRWLGWSLAWLDALFLTS